MVRRFFKGLAWLLCLAAIPAIAGEGRIPIWTSGTVISAPGQYVVTRNLPPNAAGGPVIDILAPFVDLDLNGFRLDNSGVGAPVIHVASFTEVRIRNGSLVGGVNSIEADPGRRLVIEDVNAYESGGVGFLLHDVENVALRNNRILDMATEGIVNDGGIPKSGIIEGNQIRRTRGGVYVLVASALTIRLNQIHEMFTGPNAAGITLDGSTGGCLVSQNTIELVEDDGIELRGTVGAKIHNNVVNKATDSGIFVDELSEDNLIIENAVTGTSLSSGLLIAGARNHIDENLSNFNATCGLHFTFTAFDNVIRKNVMRGNMGGAPCIAVCGAGATTDFCNLGAGNDSNLDNFMPFPGM